MNAVIQPLSEASHLPQRRSSLESLMPAEAPPAYDPSSAIAFAARLSLASSGTAQPQARSRHAAVLISRSDRLRIIGFPISCVALVDAAIRQEWKAGIQEQKAADDQSWEWKLNGKPWTGRGLTVIPSRRLIAHIFFVLQVNGWHLNQGADLSSISRDKGAIMLRSGPPAHRLVFSIVFTDDDKVRLIDAPNEVITGALHRAVRETRPFGIQQAGEAELGVYQIRIRGNPWSGASPVPGSHKRNLAFSILSAMEDEGCELLGCLDITPSTIDNGSPDRDTWLFAIGAS